MKHWENWLVKSSLAAACGVFDLSRFLDPSDFTARGNHYQSLTHLSCFLLFLCLSVGVRLTQLLAESARFVSGARCSITICCLETYPARAARTSLGLCTTFAVVKYCTPTWKHKTTVNVFMHRHTQTHQYFLFLKYFESMISLQLCFTPWQQMWKADFQQVNLWVDRCCETLGEYNAVFTHAMHRRLVLVWLDVLIRLIYLKGLLSMTAF